MTFIRFKQTIVGFPAGADIAADFEDTPLLGQREWREELQYDAITCMFAIHYFFESEKAIKTFLHNVSINLKEGDLHQALASCKQYVPEQCQNKLYVTCSCIHYQQ